MISLATAKNCELTVINESVLYSLNFSGMSDKTDAEKLQNTIRLKWRMKNLYTGNLQEGDVELAPFETVVFEV
jgi:hypothetical protein